MCSNFFSVSWFDSLLHFSVLGRQNIHARHAPHITFQQNIPTHPPLGPQPRSKMWCTEGLGNPQADDYCVNAGPRACGSCANRPWKVEPNRLESGWKSKRCPTSHSAKTGKKTVPDVFKVWYGLSWPAKNESRARTYIELYWKKSCCIN